VGGGLLPGVGEAARGRCGRGEDAGAGGVVVGGGGGGGGGVSINDDGRDAP